ncbi:MAG: CDP-diacylglycerol--glycerol-3-phosphate 3-phosphatidyltransferase [Alphaproteobacteria bacterium]|nr:CDP-diacylglycerol--glycerol-3-phosphate 3-phosphatidyltransferase [Alphaproteobacteria bacterium]MCL2758086.1 CDP-diacylglycerol--glycerol-3-phosphate 3-phosphatidyltransferase [Alphaproteobacteria bacterium]
MKVFVNCITAFRVALAFLIIPCFIFELFGIAFFLFLVAAISDFFDGYLARKYNVSTKLGAVMDHTADKFLIAIVSILIAIFWPEWPVSVPIILMICRDLYVSSLREFAGAQKMELPVGFGGKIKTVAQMVALGGLLLTIWIIPFAAEDVSYDLWTASAVALWVALGFSLLSAGLYTKGFVKKLLKSK